MGWNEGARACVTPRILHPPEDNPHLEVSATLRGHGTLKAYLCPSLPQSWYTNSPGQTGGLCLLLKKVLDVAEGVTLLSCL